ncbi:glycoside hydrolase family 3 protein [Actinoplanes sp. NPDC051343]|uniref:glycoside hydrolase family 3 protein n=1 Tax=Actinoplanes sp. NPDC051343 TaxID=3363906 RepID=UPI0037B2870D
MTRIRALLGAALSGLLIAAAPAGPVSAATDAQGTTFTPAQPVYTMDPGSWTTVSLTVTTSDGRPLSAPASLSYAGTSLLFDKGTPSGSPAQIVVAAPAATGPATATPLPLDLRVDGARLTTRPLVVVNAHGLPYLDAHRPVERRVDDLLGRMTLADKIGQMTQAERAAVTSDPSAVASLRLGSVLSGGGSAPTPNTPDAWASMVNTFQGYAMSTPLQIPLLYGIDAVHGHGNVLGATIFPHNVGLGAARDPALTYETYRATATEMRATGIPWDFAPCVCVARDERWGRAYESFGEDPGLVTRMETAIDGLQQGGVLATVKHFAGDGDTRYGTGSGSYTIDQGVTVTNRASFDRIDLAPYYPAVRDHHVGAVMPSFSSVDLTGTPVKMHANRDLITGTLKGRIGFDGFVISDWEGIHQLPDPTGAPAPTPAQVSAGVNAGIDMFMEPGTASQFEQVLTGEVAAGRVPMSRIDDAVRRILRTKFRIGLFDHPYAPSPAGTVGDPAHRAVARKAVAESQVLLKNAGGLLPLSPSAHLYVAGRNADDIGNQAGGWTLDWQGRSGASIPGTTILQGIRQADPQVTFSPDASAPFTGSDVGVVVVGETPYAEGLGDVGAPGCSWCAPPQNEPKSLALQPADRAVVSRVCAALPRCVVLVVSGRPQVIPALGSVDALVASWLPGSEGEGVADVLFGRAPFTGRLPVTWPASAAQEPINVGDAHYRPLYPYGWGLRTDSGRARLQAAAGPHPAGAVAALLASHNWDTAGRLRVSDATLRLASSALKTPAVQDTVLSVVTDAAQARALAGNGGPEWATRLARADQARTAGAATKAFEHLRSMF